MALGQESLPKCHYFLISHFFIPFLSVPLLLLLLLQASPALAQQRDSLVYLREVKVEALRLKSRTGFEQASIDSTTLQRYENTNLGQLLQQQSSLFIRSYGVSGHATPSIRGTGASHTQVYWNGLLINSPTLGQTDLSTLPVAISDEVSIQYGGASLLEGSGGLGGSISLNSHTHQNQLRLNTSANSMQNLGANLLYAYGKNRLKGSTRLVWLENSNRFPYHSLGGPQKTAGAIPSTGGEGTGRGEGGEVKIMEHARHQSRSMLQSFSYRLSPSQRLRFSSWYQTDERQLQPSLFVNLYEENMREEFWRNTLNYEFNRPEHTLQLNGGWFYNRLPQVTRYGETQSDREYVNNFQGKARYSRKLGKEVYLRSGMELMHSQALADAFNGGRKQQRLGLMAGIEFNPFDRMSIDALLRQEFVSNNATDSNGSGTSPSGGTPSDEPKNSSLLPSLALQYQLNPAWSIALNGSYNFRVLSLNEQYWASQSRRELLPEESRNLELLIKQETRPKPQQRAKDQDNTEPQQRAKNLHQGEAIHWQQSLSLFSYWVDNWIVWVPGMPSWKPENASQVHNRGLEYTFSGKAALSAQWSWQLQGSYNFTMATNQESFRGNQDAIGRQLIFTPRNKATLQGRLNYKNWHITLEELFTDKRYSRSDESEYLPAFWLTNLSLAYQYQHHQHLISARLTAHNLLNYHYQVIPFYAMPGRIMELSLSYQMNL